MKKILVIIIFISYFLLSGCNIKKDNFEDIDIYTTTYPIEYITNILYGDHSTINSIYPDGVDISSYSLTKKQINEYSKTNLYIFNGLGNEKDYVQEMFNKNKNLMIIDSTQSMEQIHGNEELWLDPSNFLMISTNIKNGLLKYINNHYLTEEIEAKYDDLKLSISNLDAKLKLLSENSSNKTIIVDNDIFKFLEKYGFTVISLEETDNLTDKTISEAISLLSNKKNTYIYTFNKNKLNNTVKDIITKTGASTIEFNKLSTITDEQRSSKEDYLSLSNDNIDKLKEELY